ncbi:hypothetical protein H0W32_03385 [Patescibacteria group bacterium]|nr:hypothetical protein [Patescibacteria group bacterium]
MSANKVQIIFGILIIVVPLLGLPSYTETVILIGLGCVMVTLAVLSHIRRRSEMHGKTYQKNNIEESHNNNGEQA